ncbi:unnamed protein product [Allacma fusca]|uniref:Uncharacterized protein n=1 Tax=Allacma fusca TaxID=39272 RepID=A0A8J2KC10_9HEXA|nr:unnamed protein product [Allacma fusca]
MWAILLRNSQPYRKMEGLKGNGDVVHSWAGDLNSEIVAFRYSGFTYTYLHNITCAYRHSKMITGKVYLIGIILLVLIATSNSFSPQLRAAEPLKSPETMWRGNNKGRITSRRPKVTVKGQRQDCVEDDNSYGDQYSMC